MAEDIIVARPYAKAIFAVALADNKLQQWSKLLNSFSLIAQDARVRKFLVDPRVNWQQRTSLFTDICEQILDEKGRNFLQVLAMNRRLSILPEIAELYEQLRAKQENIVKAKIISAMALSKQQQKKLQQALQKRWQIKIEPQYMQDKSLLGGILIRIGDQVIDGSIRGKLERLKKYLVV